MLIATLQLAGYVLTDKTKGDYVAIKVPIAPQECHRHDMKEGEYGYKTYKA